MFGEWSVVEWPQKAQEAQKDSGFLQEAAEGTEVMNQALCFLCYLL